ncbi:MAG: hypothetical protein HXY50_10300 [Ignavibacteriaceae bacterium]|nr:hypothetical protein [Ignavibacteriaceae bacterium]
MLTYFASFIIFFIAFYTIVKKLPNNKIEAEYSNTAKLIVVFGIIFRITLLPTSYTTSDDVHRYLWEGKVLVSGYNPFTHPPSDSSLIKLRDENFLGVTFKDMPAIYPPFSQIIFAINFLAAPNSQIFLKVIFLLFEIISLIFLLKLLRLKGKNLNYILLYAWLPLPVLEYFNNAHLDVVGISFLVLFLYLFEKGKVYLSSAMLALVFLTKLIALFLLPLMIRKLGIKKSIIFYLIFFSICFLFYLPFIFNNPSVLTGLFRYLEHWEFNGSVYNLLKFIFSRADIAHLLCGVLLFISVLIVSFKYKDFTKGIVSIFLLVVIFSTTVYPWYLGWLSIVNVLYPMYSLMSLFFTINLSNLTPLAPKWKEYPIVWLVEYIPFYSLLVYDLWKWNIKRQDK